MSVQAIAWALAQRIPPAPKLVLISIANCADKNGDNAFPGQRSIAEDASMCERSVRAHIAWLEGKGFLARIRRSRRDGTRTSDRYVLNMQAANLAARLEGDKRQIPAGTSGKCLPGNDPSEEPSDISLPEEEGGESESRDGEDEL
jgi:hypothetical protein